MKIFLIAGGLMAIPTLQELGQTGAFAGLAVPEQENSYTLQIRQMANMLKIPVHILSKEKLEKQLTQVLRKESIDAVFVHTFPFKIPSKVLRMPKFGFFNFHGAKLPQYRGAQPNFWEMKNGDSHSALSVHQMTSDFDTGDIVYEEQTLIEPHLTLGMLHIKLAYLNAKVSRSLIMQLQMGLIKPKKQDKSLAKYYPKPTLQDFQIDWQKQTATEIDCLVRACNPHYQGAITMLQGIQIKIFRVTISPEPAPENTKKGEIITLDENGLYVKTSDNKLLSVDMLLMEEGYLIGKDLATLGFKKGLVFGR